MVKTVNLVYGATSCPLQVGCANVGEFLTEYGPTFNIPSDGITIRVNGASATRGTGLNSGDTVEITKATGTKG